MRAILGTLIVTSILAATPTFAAPPPPNFSFGIHIGPDAPAPSPPDNYDSCLSTREIINELRTTGYRNFANFDDSGDSLVLDARRGSRWYELEVDSCSGDILSRSRIPAPY